MVRKIISIVCYVVAGFFVYMVSLLAFVSGPCAGIKFALIGGFCIPGVISLTIGLVVSRFQNWKRDMGIVLLSGSGMTALAVIMGVCLLLSPEFKEIFPENSLAFFNDILTGSIFILLFLISGMVLIKNSKRKDANKTPQPTVDRFAASGG